MPKFTLGWKTKAIYTATIHRHQYSSVFLSPQIRQVLWNSVGRMAHEQ